MMCLPKKIKKWVQKGKIKEEKEDDTDGIENRPGI